MQPDPEEKSSSDHPNQGQRADSALRYGTILKAVRHWTRIRKRLTSSDPKENHRSDSPTDYLEKLRPSSSYPYLPLKMKEPRRRREEKPRREKQELDLEN